MKFIDDFLRAAEEYVIERVVPQLVVRHPEFSQEWPELIQYKNIYCTAFYDGTPGIPVQTIEGEDYHVIAWIPYGDPERDADEWARLVKEWEVTR